MSFLGNAAFVKTHDSRKLQKRRQVGKMYLFVCLFCRLIFKELRQYAPPFACPSDRDGLQINRTESAMVGESNQTPMAVGDLSVG